MCDIYIGLVTLKMILLLIFLLRNFVWLIVDKTGKFDVNEFVFFALKRGLNSDMKLARKNNVS